MTGRVLQKQCGLSKIPWPAVLLDGAPQKQTKSDSAATYWREATDSVHWHVDPPGKLKCRPCWLPQKHSLKSTSHTWSAQQWVALTAPSLVHIVSIPGTCPLALFGIYCLRFKRHTGTCASMGFTDCWYWEPDLLIPARVEVKSQCLLKPK